MKVEQDDFQFRRNHETIYESVMRLIKKYPICKEKYAVLDAFYWYYVDGLFRYIPLDILLKLTSPESINRAFRKVMEDHPELAPTPKTRRARDGLIDKYARHYRKRKPKLIIPMK